MDMFEQNYESDNSSNDSIIPIPSKLCRVVMDDEENFSSSSDDLGICHSSTESEENEIDINNTDSSQEEESCWQKPQNKQVKISFSKNHGINQSFPEIFSNPEPHSFYTLFATDEIFQIIANQINLNAAEIIRNQQSYRLDKWTETNPDELKQFFGLILWMGLVRLPQINLYWTTSEGFSQTFPKSVMSRNRFKILLRFLYFNNDKKEKSNGSDNSLHKMVPIIDILNCNFKKYYDPDEIVFVNESIMPFSKVKFQNYFNSRHSKCSVKVFQLCTGVGYTYFYKIYSTNKIKLSESDYVEVLMSLCQDILGKGHTICTNDNFTSVDLAEKLLSMNTHLIGILQKKRQKNSQKVVSHKLKYGEYIARENKNGVTILKWKGKREILILSTKHTSEMITLNRKCCSHKKPKMLIEYNLGKSSANLLNQRKEYNSPLQKSVKWYINVTLDLLLNICVTNALVLYKETTCSSIDIANFRMKIAMFLTKSKNYENQKCLSLDANLPKKLRHEIKKKPGPTRTARRCCKVCYENNSKKFGRKVAKNCTKKVVTYCEDCVDSPFLCLDCFNAVHCNIPQ